MSVYRFSRPLICLALLATFWLTIPLSYSRTGGIRDPQIARTVIQYIPAITFIAFATLVALTGLRDSRWWLRVANATLLCIALGSILFVVFRWADGQVIWSR